MRVGVDRLWEEVAFLAYYLHWSLDELLDLPHTVRDRLTAHVSAFNLAASGTT